MEEILEKLVGLQTTDDKPEVIEEALDYIGAHLSERGMYVERFNYNGVGSLVATTKQTKSPKVMLVGHVDVVAAPDDQFKLGKENGNYTGRGVYDMKYAIAAFMQLADTIKANLQDYDFGIMVTGDEENAGPNGAGKLVENGYRAGVVVLPDAGEAHDNWKLERSAKGFLYKTATATGIAAHGSRPWQGENAIYKIIDFVNDLRREFPNQDQLGSTLNIGKINGGLAPNQVPAEASVTIDIRVPNEQEAQRAAQLLDKFAQNHGLDLQDLMPSGVPHRPDLESPLFKAFYKCFEQVVTDKKLIPEDSFGGSDARYFAQVGVPCILVNPPGKGLHADHESVEIEGVTQLHDILKLYLQEVARA